MNKKKNVFVFNVSHFICFIYLPEPLKLEAYSAKLTEQSHSITLCVVHSDKL